MTGKKEERYEEEKIRQGYTRVSEIIAQWGKYSGVDKKVLERKRQIGLYVHGAIASRIDDGTDFWIPEDCQPYFNSFDLWFKSSKISSIRNAERIYDDALKITGMPDAYIRIGEEHEPVIIDWKCTHSEMPWEWRLQGGFYWMLAHDFDTPTLGRKAIFLKLDKGGGPAKQYEYEINQWQINQCMAALTNFRGREMVLSGNIPSWEGS